MDNTESNKSETAKREEKILKFWEENKIFEKSLAKESPKGNFVFYDGPPFATGEPHYGHVLAGTIKDVIPRYKTMQGYFVRRIWGWDCHGLPIENMIEKELGLTSKKDIEEYGIRNFNKAARESVLRYEELWKKFIPRVGRWVDMDHAYKTMDASYTESVWWSFKNLFEKELVYEGFKVMPYCPHCGTSLSNFEVNQGYKDINDISVYVEFKLKGRSNTSIIAWTTTPWTLPGNVALAVGKDIDYVEIEKKDMGGGGLVRFILAKEKVSEIFGDEEINIVKEYKGKDLVGLEYEPLFDYYSKDENLKNKENGWKIYVGDFVTTEDGTGVVHMAPAFGADDYELAQKEKLPFVQHVDMEGKMKVEAKDFAEMYVKPKSGEEKERLATDIEVIKYLQVHGTFFDKKKINHSYPHCWRCDTPLLNYATTSWFVKVTDLKEKMQKLNERVKWIPAEIGENRFGKWLVGARDWAISRSRYWGAPIPVWQNKAGERLVIGSIDELKKYTKKSGNKYFTIRHGEAEQNIKDIINSDPKNIFHLTEQGKKQVQTVATDIKKENIDLIISSPFVRCKDTAEIIRENLDLNESMVVIDDRLGEFKKGPNFEGKNWDEYWKLFANTKERFEKAPDGGENLFDLNKRVGDFLYDTEQKYSGKNILIVSHEGPIAAMHMVALGATFDESVQIKEKGTYKSDFAQFLSLDFVPLPHNENYELDLHRPYIDEVELVDEKGDKLKRVKEVFDTWYDSGSMPYAQTHYPFENKEYFERGDNPIFPADFIAEGLDQTRGWFYTLLVLGTGLFNKSPYQNVIVNGIVLAEDGQKMSKRLKNYPDPSHIIDKYGADALRYYMISSQVVRGEDLAFSEKGLDEVSKKIVLKLENILSFYQMYSNEVVVEKVLSENILDKWIIGRLNQVGGEITKSLDNYRLDLASRPILDFVDDFSIWYIRRSRERFKSENLVDKKDALNTTRFVLLELAKYMAPFTPFFAEHLYLSLKSDSDPESVHLCSWVTPSEVEGRAKSKEILEMMEEVRGLVSLALEKRMVAGVKVRQPLKSLKVKSKKLESKEDYLELIKDEINVKEVLFDENIENEVELDTNITPELQKEGNTREFIRAIQDLRKQKNLSPLDVIVLEIETDDKGREFIEDVASEIKKPTNISKILFSENNGIELKIENYKFKIQIK